VLWKLPVTLPDWDCTADVMFHARGMLSDGTYYKVSREELWLVFLEYMLAAKKKDQPVWNWRSTDFMEPSFNGASDIRVRNRR
jgi:hypothetical protein